MSAATETPDAEVASLALARASEQELVEMFHEASTPEARLRVIDELGRLRRGDRQ